MSFGLVYWILMLLWLLSELAPRFGLGGAVVASISTALIFILFLLLGWKVFGPPVHP